MNLPRGWLLVAVAVACCTAEPGRAPAPPAGPHAHEPQRRDRVVRVLLDGLMGPYELSVQHESGRVLRESGTVASTHVLHLPPGPCILGVTRSDGTGSMATVHLAFTVTEEPEQHLEWHVPLPN